jgi:membrane carboxypeptidase/penicillin-binding protein
MVYGTLQRPVAGKSGTTDSNRTAWFCGFTPQLAAAAFVADPDDPNDHVGAGRSRISKYTVAQTLRDALKGQPELKFTPPSRQLTYRHSRWSDTPRWGRGTDNRWRSTDTRSHTWTGHSRSTHPHRNTSANNPG